MAESIGTARLDVVVDTASLEVGIERAKRSVSGMSTQAQAEYEKLNAAEKRRVDSLRKQADMLGLTREQQLAYNITMRTSGTVQQELLSRIQRTNQGLQQGAKQLSQYGMTAGQTANAMRQLPMQLTDITVGLATGQKPMMVLLQQGGQLKDMFGGIVPAARALGGAVLAMINPLTVGAAAAAALAVAWKQGSDEQFAFERALVMTGHRSGLTADQLSRLSGEIAGLSGGTTRAAAQALTQVVAAGRFTAEQVSLVTTAAEQMRVATGREIGETIAEFERIRKDPVEAILELNDKYGFLTKTQLENIRTLRDQGEAQEAVTEGFRAYAAAIGELAPKVTENLGYIDRAIRLVKLGTAALIDDLRDIGRDQTTLDQFDSAGRRLAAVYKQIEEAQRSGNDNQAEYFKNKAAELLELRKQLSIQLGAGERPNVVDSDAERAAEKQRAEQAKWHEESVRFASDRERLEQSIVKMRAEAVKLGIEESHIRQRESAMRADFEGKQAKKTNERAGSGSDPVATLLNRVRQQLALNEAQLQSTERLTTSERLRVEVVRQLDQLGVKATDTRRREIEAELEKAVASEAAANAARNEGKAKQDLLSLQEQLRVSEENYRRQTEIDLMSIGRGADEVDRMQRRLELQRELEDGLDRIRRDATGKTDEALRAEEAVLRESIARRLTEEERYQAERQRMLADGMNGATRAWEDYLAGAADMAGQTYDLFANAFGGMEDAIVEFARTGKLSFSDLADSIVSDLARIAAKQMVTGLMGNAFGQMFGSFAVGGYTGPGAVNQPAGVVHRGEVVWSQKDVARAGGVGAVEAMRLGLRGYANGGVVGMPSPSSGLQLVINNNAPARVTAREETGSGPGGIDFKKIIVDIAADDMARGGRIASAAKGRFNLREAR